MNHSLVIPNL